MRNAVNDLIFESVKPFVNFEFLGFEVFYKKKHFNNFYRDRQTGNFGPLEDKLVSTNNFQTNCSIK